MNSDEPVQRNASRRKYMIGAAATGGALVVGGTLMASTTAQNENDGDTVEAEFCGEFTEGPQSQQCIACVEEECEGEVNPLTPLFTGLTGQCFTPEEIPEGADYVTLKAAQNCYIAPVDDFTTFCLPDGEPDISNATFYRCGGEPTPEIVEKTVTCDAITITTENIEDGTTLTATVTFVDADDMESEQPIDATVEDDQATFTLPGDLNPVYVVITLNDDILDEQPIEAEDAPCFEEPGNGDDGKDKKKKKGEVSVDLDGICYKEDKGKGQFRIVNHEKRDVMVTWKVTGTTRSGTITVSKRGSETVWVKIDTDQKLGLYFGEDRIAETAVNTQAC